MLLITINKNREWVFMCMGKYTLWVSLERAALELCNPLN